VRNNYRMNWEDTCVHADIAYEQDLDDHFEQIFCSRKPLVIDCIFGHLPESFQIRRTGKFNRKFRVLITKETNHLGRQ